MQTTTQQSKGKDNQKNKLLQMKVRTDIRFIYPSMDKNECKIINVSKSG
jgi:hypothetical protein